MKTLNNYTFEQIKNACADCFGSDDQDFKFSDGEKQTKREAIDLLDEEETRTILEYLQE